ncbi:GntR family transcriptional regulator [Kitasatospora paracochleata]|uniref:DNA-binding GntR family transcriptional regulator n=1 Tax=Kitasatospora paracochleata TaxID=58354 RepID=A0ABT1J056_9ACTN|nr:GntR family transcriptional regulator [Kitasatospora paracochleata]MCP2310574.1 DNA-binding GntR family transcriptional regulator [Kitasatospora paracochleata]
MASPRSQRPQSVAEWTVGELRALIADGEYPPGTRLSEEEVGKQIGVSRNTLREAFRLLAHERLLVQMHNKGVFVRTLDEADVEDLFRVRRMVELAAVRDLPADPARLARVAAAVAEADVAEAQGDWRALGSANLHFHQAIAGLSGSPRVDELMERVTAELRLAFHAMEDPLAFHKAYVERNRQILALLRDAKPEAVEAAVGEYLATAEKEILDAYRTATPPAGGQG